MPANPRGLIFDGALVPGVMSGAITVTTRIMKPQPELDPKLGFLWKGRCYGTNIDGTPYLPNLLAQSPFRVGEKRYVKEAWATNGMQSEIYYRADTADFPLAHGPWRSPMMMPRWAARTWVEIVSVRPARCQEITEEEIGASGVTIPVEKVKDPPVTGLLRLTGDYPPIRYFPDGWLAKNHTIEENTDVWLRAHYASLWDRPNAKRGFPWSASPWVWRIGFRLTEAAVLAAPKGASDGK